MNFDIVHLPKEKWQDTALPIGYSYDEYYDVAVVKSSEGFRADFIKRHSETKIPHTPEEHDFPDRLYAKWWPGAYAWGILSAGGELLGAIETCPEEWSNRLRITELWVDESIRRRGAGRALMDIAKEQARLERRRAIMLETQSSNAGAISFYLSQGFSLSGFDTCCYSNDDIKKREVRMELAFMPDKPGRVPSEQIEIRPERTDDMHGVELLTQRAFWNKHAPGCNEHLLVHKLRNDGAYLPELSRIAVVDGKLAGCIMYSAARVVRPYGRDVDVITFGPLCVDPEYQGRGVGGALLKYTLSLAADAGCRGVIIYGEPVYYPLFGFKTCDRFGITTPDGKNFDAFMGYELVHDGLALKDGKFYEAEVFESIGEEETEAFNAEFPTLAKQRFPSQWA